MHAPPQLLQSLLRQRFWIMASRGLTRSVFQSCIYCFKVQPRNKTPLMGDLPAERVQQSPPFHRTALDFCGHFNVKLHQLRYAIISPVYVCVFVCMSTKAIHLEMISKLSTDAFVAALQRFVSRRGKPAYIYCDNANNFQGAANRFLKLITSEDPNLILFSHNNRVEFRFNVPLGPHLGGLYEAAVKSFKLHLKRVMGDSVLTQEEFQTLTARIEAILNSRPLTPLSSDPRDYQVLPPGHFLIGRPLVALPERQYDTESPPFLHRWNLVELYAQQFWQHWPLEYLHTLQPRGKWLEQAGNLEEGTLVLLHDPQSPPLKWTRGRVLLTFPGKDNNTRVVEVKTPDGVYKRPVVNLYALPLGSSQ